MPPGLGLGGSLAWILFFLQPVELHVSSMPKPFACFSEVEAPWDFCDVDLDESEHKSRRLACLLWSSKAMLSNLEARE